MGKYYTILCKRLEDLWILISVGDIEGLYFETITTVS